MGGAVQPARSLTERPLRSSAAAPQPPRCAPRRALGQALHAAAAAAQSLAELELRDLRPIDGSGSFEGGSGGSRHFAALAWRLSPAAAAAVPPALSGRPPVAQTSLLSLPPAPSPGRKSRTSLLPLPSLGRTSLLPPPSLGRTSLPPLVPGPSLGRTVVTAARTRHSQPTPIVPEEFGVPSAPRRPSPCRRRLRRPCRRHRPCHRLRRPRRLRKPPRRPLPL